MQLKELQPRNGVLALKKVQFCAILISEPIKANRPKGWDARLPGVSSVGGTVRYNGGQAKLTGLNRKDNAGG